MAGGTKGNIIITGASGNLGRVVVPWFLQKGYSVFATVSSDASVKNLPKHENLLLEKVNLKIAAEAHAFFEKVKKETNHIDAAFFLAGGYAGGNVFSTSLNKIHEQIALNFDTAYNLLQPVFSLMMEQRQGRIVLVGARPALQAADGAKMLAYGLSKSMLVKLAEYLNAEAKGTNVTTTVIIPSTIDTEDNRKAMPIADTENWVSPEHISEILEFLLSKPASSLRETVLKVYNRS